MAGLSLVLLEGLRVSKDLLSVGMHCLMNSPTLVSTNTLERKIGRNFRTFQRIVRRYSMGPKPTLFLYHAPQSQPLLLFTISANLKIRNFSKSASQTMGPKSIFQWRAS